MDKRIYSLNLMAYIAYQTDYPVKIYESDDNKYYAVFPEDDKVSEAIKLFKDAYVYEFYLHKFLNIFKDIKKQISEFRNNQYKNKGVN
jgi:hypothetical protein